MPLQSLKKQHKKMAEIEPYKEERPAFGPTQVRNLEDVLPGKRFIWRNEVNPELNRKISFVFVIEGLPYKKESTDFLSEGGWLVKVRKVSVGTGESDEQIIDPSDFSVAPNTSGLWNQVSWWEDPAKIPPPSDLRVLGV